MSKRNKHKDEKNLIWIEPITEGESALTTALRVLDMVKDDYNLSIREISEILLCDRQWVQMNIKDNVKHIFLNENYRKFLTLINWEQDNEYVNLKDFYYFSREDFFKWLHKNTKVTRQTIRIDLINYTDYKDDFKKTVLDFKDEMRVDHIPPRKKAKIVKTYEDNILDMLNDVGKEFYKSRVIPTKRKIEAVKVNAQELPEFASLRELKKFYAGPRTNSELIYRNLFMFGALKYTIADSLIRYDNSYNQTEDVEGGYIITIPYKLFSRYLFY